MGERFLLFFHGTAKAEHGGVPEWPKGADCKSAAECFGGSNPSPATVSVRPRSACEVLLSSADCESDPGSIRLFRVAPIAQSAERLHGKEKVKGSIPFRGSGRGLPVAPRRGSSAGQSARLIIVRSRVRAPPPLPIEQVARRHHYSAKEDTPWQASLRMFAPRSLWPARSARSATTSRRRTVVTRRIVSSSRSTARAATSRRLTARPAEPADREPPKSDLRGFPISVSFRSAVLGSTRPGPRVGCGEVEGRWPVGGCPYVVCQAAVGRCVVGLGL